MAAGALVPLIARRPATVGLVVAAASLYCASGVISIARTDPSQATAATQDAAFARLAREEHVNHGYTGYWDAAPITWGTRFHVLAYPVVNSGASLTRSIYGSESAWYTPHPHERTFLITDTAKPYMQSAPPTLGPPAAAIHVGSSYTFLVYNYDIASRIQP
jgi:hypothetical protein